MQWSLLSAATHETPSIWHPGPYPTSGTNPAPSPPDLEPNHPYPKPPYIPLHPLKPQSMCDLHNTCAYFT